MFINFTLNTNTNSASPTEAVASSGILAAVRTGEVLFAAELLKATTCVNCKPVPFMAALFLLYGATHPTLNPLIPDEWQTPQRQDLLRMGIGASATALMCNGPKLRAIAAITEMLMILPIQTASETIVSAVDTASNGRLSEKARESGEIVVDAILDGVALSLVPVCAAKLVQNETLNLQNFSTLFRPHAKAFTPFMMFDASKNLSTLLRPAAKAFVPLMMLDALGRIMSAGMLPDLTYRSSCSTPNNDFLDSF